MSAPLIPTDTLTRYRFAAGSVDGDGKWVRGAESSTTFSASVQPMKERDLQVLPEGIRQTDSRRVYAPFGTLRTANQHDQTDADEVTIDGARYRVHHVESQRALIPHDKAIVVRLGEAT